VDIATPMVSTFNALPGPVKTAAVAVTAAGAAALVAVPRIIALREALERLRDAAQAFRGRRAVDWSDPTEKPLTDALVAASATLAAVRAETLAGAGVVEVCEQVSEGWPCGQTRDRHDGAYISHPYQPATPPTPALTAARCGYLIRMLGLTPFICNRAEDDALHRSRTHPDAHSFLTATHTPERLLDAIEAAR
jgi:hypothetical protein